MASSASSGGKGRSRRTYVAPPAGYYDMTPEQKKEFARDLVDQIAATRQNDDTNSDGAGDEGGTSDK